MNIYMLGNGFDLHYNFPTKYANFIHTLSFLIKQQEKEFTSIGQVFGDEDLRKIDEDINRAYSIYANSYNNVGCNPRQLIELAKNAKINIWFTYLSEMVSTNSGWIDAEKEIATVVEILDQVLSETERFHDKIVIGSMTTFDNAKTYIVDKFDFFWKDENQEETYGLNTVKRVILREFLIEEPKGSKNYRVDRISVANKLYEELMKLAEMLRAYLNSTFPTS